MNTPPTQADPALASVRERFPGLGKQILELAPRDQKFRDVCDDYCLAKAALTDFERSPSQGNGQVVAEYIQLVADLESEILDLLKSGENNAQEQ